MSTLPLQAVDSASLDTTFNPVGTFPGVPGVETIISLTQYFGAGTGAANVQGFDIAQQPDGQLIALGIANPTIAGDGAASGASKFSVVRLNVSDGSLDTTFNPVGTFVGAPGVETLGLVQTFSVGTTAADTPSSIAVQSDGKIILFGLVTNPTAGAPARTAALVRLNTNGALDTSWNPVGTFPGNPGAEFFAPVATTFGAGATLFSVGFERLVAIQSNGQVLFAGQSNPTAAGGTSMSIGRLNGTNGSLDISWNPNPPATFPGVPGVETFPLVATFGVGATAATSGAVVIQSDGQILLGGTVTIAGVVNIAVLRLNLSNGGLDNSWSGDGVVTVPPATLGATTITNALSMAVQSDDKSIIVGLATVGGVARPYIGRFTTSGVVDTSFNAGGANPGFLVIPASAFGGSVATAQSVRIQTDGTIVITGNTTFSGLTSPYVARVLPNGTLDPSFNQTGTLPGSPGVAIIPTTNFGTNVTLAQGNALVIQSNGKIVFLGRANPDFGTGSEQSFAFGRLNGTTSGTFSCIAAAIAAKYC